MASVESQLGGQAKFDWRAEGLLCRLQVPLALKATLTMPAGKFGEVPSGGLQRASG
jgi:hypothetical protein